MNLETRDPHKRLDEFRRRSSVALDELFAELPDAMNHDEPIVFQPDVDLIETRANIGFIYQFLE
jgi:hypothetical protein